MRDNKGFTLIELLIVVVIIGILAAIAIPKFSATREKAYFAAMKSDLKNLASQQEIYYSSNYAYSSSSGDLGFVDAEGYVHLGDRRSNLIISGGVNIYPAEVEHVLQEHPAGLRTVASGGTWRGAREPVPEESEDGVAQPVERGLARLDRSEVGHQVALGVEEAPHLVPRPRVEVGEVRDRRLRGFRVGEVASVHRSRGADQLARGTGDRLRQLPRNRYRT